MDLIQEHHRSPILKASRHPRPFSVSRKDLKAQLESIDEKLSMSTSEVDALEMQQIEKQRLQICAQFAEEICSLALILAPSLLGSVWVLFRFPTCYRSCRTSVTRTIYRFSQVRTCLPRVDKWVKQTMTG